MLNLQICTVIIMTKKKKKKKKNIKKINENKKSCDSRDSNPGHMGRKSTKISITDKNNQYMLKL